MKKISIKQIIEFNQKESKRKKAFVTKLTTPKITVSSGGGDYWVRRKSALSNAFKFNDNSYITKKIEDIQLDHAGSQKSISKKMYQRNIDILENYIEFDFTKWSPTSDLEFLKGVKANSIIEIDGLSIQIIPDQVFSYEQDGFKMVGAILFIAKLNKYDKAELDIFGDALHSYLKYNYAKHYKIDPKYCIVIDVINQIEIRHSKPLGGKKTSALKSIINEMNSLLKK